MRTLTLLITIISLNAYSQSKYIDIVPKKTHTIILNDTISEQQLAEVLLSNGYSIATVNEYTLKTEPKMIKYWGYDIVASNYKAGYKLSIFMNSTYRYGVSSPYPRSIVKYRGMKDSSHKVGFRELLKVAEQFNCYLKFL